MRYSKLFVGRQDTFATAVTKGKGYRPVKGRLTPRRIAQHLSGEHSFGIYLIRPKDSSVKVMAYDIDKSDRALVKRICGGLRDRIPDTSILVEQTGGRGWHIWIFSAGWVSARTARAFLRAGLEGINLSYPVEIYPKQDRVRGGGLGNLMRLPLGVHQKTGETGQIFNAHLKPFDIDEDDDDPELPIEPAPAVTITAIGDSQLEIEKAKMATVTGDESAPATLPCIDRFQRGVSEGYRDEAAFRLAAYLHRQGIPKEAAFVTLAKANESNTPPMASLDLQTKLDSAYSGAGYGLPCSSDLVGLDSPFCSPNCSVYATAKARAVGVEVGQAPGAPQIKFPRVIERDGIYVYQTRVQQGIKEVTISNFKMEVLSRLEMPDDGADVLRMRIVAQAGREDIMDMPVHAFSSKQNMLRILARAEYSWYGTDLHCQYLKSYLTRGELDTQQAMTKLGRVTTEEGDIWITPNAILTQNGIMKSESSFTYHRPEHYGRVSIKAPKSSFSLDKTRKTLKSIFEINTLSVMSPIVGWAFSLPFKPWFVRQLGHFPLLMLYGTRGAGKTQLVQRLIMPLFGYSSREPQIHFCDTTRFVLVSYGASTTSIPLFFDEYRPNALPGTKLRQLWDHWRHLYAEDTDHRGQADLSRLDFKQTAPVVVAGEEMVNDPAMQERMIQVALSPDFLTQKRQIAFRGLPPLEMASQEFIKQCLKIDPVPLLDDTKARIAGEWEQRMSPRLYDNILIASFGLSVWAKITQRTVTKRMQNAIYELPEYLISSKDGDVRTALWVDDFILDIAAIIDDKGPFKWGAIERKTGEPELLHFNLRKAHAEWSKDMRTRGDQAAGLNPIKRQLAEQATDQFVLARNEQRRILGYNTRVYTIDLAAMREALDE